MLYEMSLPKKPYPVVFQNVPLDHLRACYSMSKDELNYWAVNPEALNKIVTDRLIEQLKPAIQQRVRSEKDYYSYRMKYSVDVWVERE
jgi:hypothetical protein